MRELIHQGATVGGRASTRGRPRFREGLVQSDDRPETGRGSVGLRGTILSSARSRQRPSSRPSPKIDRCEPTRYATR